MSRRRFLATSVAVATALELQQAAWALSFSSQAPVCRLVAEQEEGPYYIGGEQLRSNVTEDRPGIPLALRIGILDARSCEPLQGVAVDIWSCDALGSYSGFTKENAMGPRGPGGPPPGFDPQHPGNGPGSREGFGPPPVNPPTDKLTFLRGVQMTDSDGIAIFTTIIPGFYMGRTNHIHFRVRIGLQEAEGKLPAGHISHTGQIFLPDSVLEEVMRHPPYSNHKIHRTKPHEDAVFTGQHGDLSVAKLKPTSAGKGYEAELVAGIDPTSTPKRALREGGPIRLPSRQG